MPARHPSSTIPRSNVPSPQRRTLVVPGPGHQGWRAWHPARPVPPGTSQVRYWAGLRPVGDQGSALARPTGAIGEPEESSRQGHRPTDRRAHSMTIHFTERTQAVPQQFVASLTDPVAAPGATEERQADAEVTTAPGSPGRPCRRRDDRPGPRSGLPPPSPSAFCLPCSSSRRTGPRRPSGISPASPSRCPPGAEPSLTPCSGRYCGPGVTTVRHLLDTLPPPGRLATS